MLSILWQCALLMKEGFAWKLMRRAVKTYSYQHTLQLQTLLMDAIEVSHCRRCRGTCFMVRPRSCVVLSCRRQLAMERQGLLLPTTSWHSHACLVRGSCFAMGR